GRAGAVQRGHALRGGPVGPGRGQAQHPPGRPGPAPGHGRHRGRPPDPHLRAPARRAPLAVVAAAVAASNVVAWTGYAGMRAEVAATDPRGAAMTWYMVAVAAIEGAGTPPAAPLPTGPARPGPGAWPWVAGGPTGPAGPPAAPRPPPGPARPAGSRRACWSRSSPAM